MSSVAGLIVDNNFPLQGKGGTVVAAPLTISSGVDFLQATILPSDLEHIVIPEAGDYLVCAQLNHQGTGVLTTDYYGVLAGIIGKLDGGPDVPVCVVSNLALVVAGAPGSYKGRNMITTYAIVRFTGSGELFIRADPAFYGTAAINEMIAGTVLTATQVDIASGTFITV